MRLEFPSKIISNLFLNLITTITISQHLTDGKQSDIEPLIFHGYKIPHTFFARHLVSLRFGDDYGYFGSNHYCGGVILSENVILTAAHCVVNRLGYIRDVERLIIVAGSTHRLQIDEFTRIHRVRKSLPYPRYDSNLIKGDVGLMFLSEPLVEDEMHIKRLPITDKKPQPGDECFTYGWGNILPDGPRPDELLYLNVTIEEPKHCRPNHIYTSGVICVAIIDGRDTGRGDSGGPLICDGKLAGLVSYNTAEFFLTFFADVWAYRHWIIENEACLLSDNICWKWLFCYICLKLLM